VDAGLNVQTTDPSSPTLHVYSQSFAAGAISLGGNLATGASGANSNYLVVVVEQ
jgi:FAD/FMN-containing dehydrogenase